MACRLTPLKPMNNPRGSLLDKLAAGVPGAAAELLDRYGDLIWSLARRYLNDRAEAEDAVQDIVIELWSKAGRYDPRFGSELTFVAMIARRRLIDRKRRDQREPVTTALEAEAMASGSLGATLEQSAELARVERAIDGLGADQQRVLELALYGGYTHRDIAEQTGMPLGTVKTHLRRGLIAVREVLERKEARDGDA
jgi:RNA polymerase sigma factor (sigma-70 family)